MPKMKEILYKKLSQIKTNKKVKINKKFEYEIEE